MAFIYCIEDDLNIQELISCALKSGGHNVNGFSCSKEFFSAIEKEHPDLILMDVMLPDEDGFTILKKLKAVVETKKIPVIMLTAKSSEIDKVRGLEAGADDYITKPFGVMELLSRIKAVLRRTSFNETENQESDIYIEKLRISPVHRSVYYNEKEVILTYKEFEVLSYLSKHIGVAVSRNRLLEKVWGFQYEGETRTVDVHIKTLRQKLDSAGCKNLIETVRGYGYKISK